MNRGTAGAVRAEFEFPWQDLEASRRNKRLQQKYPADAARRQYLARANQCLKCGRQPDQLAWFYFRSPNSTWETECGTAGWMLVCDRCNRQVDYFAEVIS